MCRLTKAVPDASSHSFFKCPTYREQKNCRFLRSQDWQRRSALRKRIKKKGREKKTHPRRNDLRYRREGEASKVSTISKGEIIEVMVFDVPMPTMKMIQLMMESMTPLRR